MKIQTKAILPKPPHAVWPLLCNSHMDEHIPCLFRFGIPKPVECKLPPGEGGVGLARQCISDQGKMNQKITVWEKDKKLCFEMKDTDMYFGACVTSIKEQFELLPLENNQTQITRTTEFQVSGFLKIPKSLLIWIGLKNVHRYVFKNWKMILQKDHP